MNDLSYLIQILESSVKRHGEKPLTNRWMLNIVKMAERVARDEEYRMEWDGLGLDDVN